MYTHAYIHSLCLSFGTSARMLLSTRFLAYSRDKKIWGIKIYHVTTSLPAIGRRQTEDEVFPQRREEFFFFLTLTWLQSVHYWSHISSTRGIHLQDYLLWYFSLSYDVRYDVQREQYPFELCEFVIFWEWERNIARFWREDNRRIILLVRWLFLDAINVKLFFNWSMTGCSITDEAFFSLFVRASRFQCVIRSSTNGQTCSKVN